MNIVSFSKAYGQVLVPFAGGIGLSPFLSNCLGAKRIIVRFRSADTANALTIIPFGSFDGTTFQATGAAGITFVVTGGPVVANSATGGTVEITQTGPNTDIIFPWVRLAVSVAAADTNVTIDAWAIQEAYQTTAGIPSLNPFSLV